MGDAAGRSQLWDRLRALVTAETGRRPEHLAPGITLFGDLGIDGDDAVEVSTLTQGPFDVDLTAWTSVVISSPKDGRSGCC